MTHRATMDLDIVGLLVGDKLRTAQPLPTALEEAITTTARLLDLPTVDAYGKAWMNSGPTMLLKFGGLPPGFLSRTTRRAYGRLGVHLASRLDLIFL